MSAEKNVACAELLQRIVMAYVLEEVSRHGSLREQMAHVVSFGITVERLVELADCSSLLTIIDIEALATLLNVTAGQLIVRAQRAQLSDPVPHRVQVRHE